MLAREFDPIRSLLQYVTDRLALYVQAYTLYSSVRPFGLSTILGGVDKDGPALYVVEPSGVYFVRSNIGTSLHVTHR